MKSQFKKNTAIILSLFCVILLNAQKSNQDMLPNIIFLLTDDQRYDALGCLGNTEIHTPNIDLSLIHI